ncbi:helicase-like protein [Murinocardiopsis flavida]|uniref:Helicase-like protein n=1 Tax=Murinocardiopsis flavida TaxID=645275 RepID=A0A2P8D956_9ACTN|nr:DEAD/DEAH box helicase [Murinocardiopsis flavida]PSK93727.1 helicase-like protein [Murinocardiopsis flavida]
MNRDAGGGAADPTAPASYPAVFEPGDPARTGRLVFYSPDGAAPPPGPGRTGTVAVAVPDGTGGVRIREVPARRVGVGAALGVLTGAPARGPGVHPATAFWAAAARLALHLLARGRILPGVSDAGYDAWRAGPLDPGDVERLRALADAMPAHARAVPVAGSAPPELPHAPALLRSFVDAVADTLPRTPAAPAAAGGPVFAAADPQHVPGLRDWARELAAGLDTGVRVSLRVEVPGGDFAHGPYTAVVQVRSLADPTLVGDAADLWDPGRPAAAAFGPRARIDTVLAVRRAAAVWPPLDRLLDRAVPDELALTDEEVGGLTVRGAADLAASGVDVHWPAEVARSLTATAVAGSPGGGPVDAAAVLGGGHLLDFNWRLALGGADLTDQEMDYLAEQHRPVVRLRDQWVLVDPEMARRARERDLKPLPAIEALGAALSGTAVVDGAVLPAAAQGWVEEVRARIAAPGTGADSVAQPAGLRADLRDYQRHGLGWLARMTDLGLGGCLADDMGLGKTITLIALHLHRRGGGRDPGPTLVVCPASLLGNWEREIARFAPSEPVRRFHGPGRTLDGAASGFVLTTYATLRMDPAALAETGWDLVVADEAQHVKNPRSGTATALRAIGARARVALTGTPVENSLSELWAILDWTTPGLLGTLGAFRRRWSDPVEGGAAPETAEQLSRLVRPFLLRRRKSDPGIAPELPPKTQTDQAVALTREQAALYEAVVRETMDRIRSAEGMARRGLVMSLLTALKQVCNHPAQYLKEDAPRLAGRSGKLELLEELLETITAEGGAVLVFTQYVAMARLLEKRLAQRGMPALLLHGGTPVARREEMVARFQDGGAPVFLLSLKAAGTGLNLTRADHVVHYDRWWNPAVEDQATDRAYRIGQTRPVQVHRLVAEGTVEDRITAMLAAKRDLAESVLGGGEAALSELSDAELAELVELKGGPR